MALSFGSTRIFLAAVMALWTPLWCSCAASGDDFARSGNCRMAGSAEPTQCMNANAVEESGDAPLSSDEEPSQPCSCEGSLAVDAALVNIAEPHFTGVPFVPILHLSLNEHVLPSLDEEHVVAFASHVTPPSGGAQSLLALHCKLTI